MEGFSVCVESLSVDTEKFSVCTERFSVGFYSNNNKVLNDDPHISAINPEKGFRSVTVGRNDLRRMQMMAICTLNECPNRVCGRPRKGRYTHCHLSEGALHTSVTERWRFQRLNHL